MSRDPRRHRVVILRILLLASVALSRPLILSEENVSDYARVRIEECFEHYAEIFDAVHSESRRFSILRKQGFIEAE